VDYQADYSFDFFREKDLVLREVRNIGFADIIIAIRQGDLFDAA